MSSLENIILAQIRRFGPMSVADYMTLCLLHPEHGYYIRRDPLGAGGDFTTAPEISQLFGEMIGLFLGQCWMDQEKPERFILAEPGPGHGTLMADILRVTKAIPGFHEAAEVYLIEASPTLTKIQEQTLSGYSVHWAKRIEDLPDLPIFLVANEFFDALPIRQYIRSKDGWQEQMIGEKDGRLVFGLAAPLPVEALEDRMPDVQEGRVVETCAPALGLVETITRQISRKGGVALVLDYGDDTSTGDTLQAVQRHRKVDPLESPGEADLTAHVDFAALARSARDVSVTKLTAQGVFLERLGITARAQALAAGLSGEKLESHIAAHRRLTHPEEMGTLFKAIAFYHLEAPLPPGFDC